MTTTGKWFFVVVQPSVLPMTVNWRVLLESQNHQEWQFAAPPPPSALETFADLDPTLVQILYNRGITDLQTANQFFARDESCSPFRLRGMSEAVTRIRRAIRKGEKIFVYGDYDADGITATALMVETLSALGGQVKPFIPSRSDDGYGVRRKVLDRISGEGATLMITVDCGIRDLQALRHAKNLGLDAIVIDHHTVAEALPPAIAVINPKQVDCEYPFEDLCGVGLAFKVAQGMLRVEQQISLNRKTRELTENDLLDLVALGTVADLVPLVGENRSLVSRGIAQLRKTRRPGLRFLARLARLNLETLNAEDIGFRIAPQINATGRIANPSDGYRLLMTQDSEEAERLAAHVGNLNRQRQKLTADMAKRALSSVQEPPGNILIIADEQFPEGLMGLIASKLTEQFYRPAVVIALGDETSRASARSIPEFNITRALDACRDRLIRHGGHAMAAGFTIANRELPAFKAQLEALAKSALAGKSLQPTLFVDAVVPIQNATADLYDHLQKLAPFGYGNQIPRLASLNVEVRAPRTVGAEGTHLKFSVPVPGSSEARDCIAFRQGKWYGHLPDRVDLAYHLEMNHWNKQTKLQLNVQELRASA